MTTARHSRTPCEKRLRKWSEQMELMELYKREKINPLAGCLPILVQIPVFFALYKVLFVTIEMRIAAQELRDRQ